MIPAEDARPAETGTATASEAHFTGKERDAETANDYFEARYCASAQGRFNSPDPGNAGADQTNPQSWDMYGYVGNNPTAYFDPSGLSCTDPNDTSVPCFTVTGSATPEAPVLGFPGAAQPPAPVKPRSVDFRTPTTAPAPSNGTCLANVGSFVNTYQQNAQTLANNLRNGATAAEVLAVSGNETSYGGAFASFGNFFGLHGNGPAGLLLSKLAG